MVMVLSAEYTHFTASSRALRQPTAAIAGEVASTRSASMQAAEDNKREYFCTNNIINLAGILGFELAPTHGLSTFILKKDFRLFFTVQGFHLFIFQFLFIQGTDEHQICKLLYDS
jgi:hypothetical protein